MMHTPGPWITIRQRGKYEGNYNIGRKDDIGKGPLLTFASIFGPNDVCPPEYAEAAEANANLMAAAPDLLAALEAVEWSVDYVPVGSGSTYYYCPSCKALQEDGHTADCKLDAALAKAKAR